MQREYPRELLKTLARQMRILSLRRWVDHDSSEAPWVGHALAFTGWAMVTAGAAGFAPWLGNVGVVLGYLLVITLVAVRYGRRPALVAALLSAAILAYFLLGGMARREDLPLGHVLVASGGLLGTALVVAYLIADLRLRANQATLRQLRAEALYAMSRELSSALLVEQITDIAMVHLDAVFQAQVVLLLPDASEQVQRLPGSGEYFEVRSEIAQWVYDQQLPAGYGSDTFASSRILYLPLQAPMRTRGVLVIAPANPQRLQNPERRRLLDAFTAQIALALERLHYVQVAQEAEVNMASERLRNSLLAAISHDLRTPLTALVGLASTLAAPKALAETTRTELAEAIHEEALRMSSLVVNLLDMARLEVGRIRLNQQWQLPEEVIGSAIRASRLALTQHTVRTQISTGQRLVAFDAVLIERVLCNLLENASKYTPAGSVITLSAAVSGAYLLFSVSDLGPGLPPGREEAIFEKFTRGEKLPTQPGVGLGLAICRAVVDAHQGRIWASNNAGGGACFSFTVPLGESPTFGEDDAHNGDVEPAMLN